MKNELNIGIIGPGGFAAFAAKAFLQIPGIKIIAVTDINKAVAEIMAKELHAEAYGDMDSFLENTQIDLVYIATPPFLHFDQSKKALLAGKHVICEKPAALRTCEVEELQSLARSLQLLYVVNLMQRYNPLYDIVKTIVKEKIAGNFLRGYFENYASDENLNHDHWFWDRLKSGGIFIEHGVHFFDMFSGWLGDGKVLHAVHLHRLGEKDLIDRVQATVLYRNGIVNFYHGFDQPVILDRQEIRLQFERGEITLNEWVPVKMRLHGLFTSKELKRLHELIHGFSIVRHPNNGANKSVRGRFKAIHFDEHITIEYGNVSEKQSRYQEILTAMMKDQWAWIKDRTHARVIDDTNAVESVRVAESATKLAQNF